MAKRSRETRGRRRKWTVERRKIFAKRFWTVLQGRYTQGQPFEGLKRELSAKKCQTAESTIRNWLPPLARLQAGTVRKVDWDQVKTPDSEPLCEIAELLGVSIDYLIGRDVPPRASDRERIGDLARDLAQHIVRDYFERQSENQFGPLDWLEPSSALVHLVDGEYVEFAGSEMLDGTEWSIPRKTGEWISENCCSLLATEDYILAVEFDPQKLLTKMLDSFANEANAYFVSHKKLREENVRVWSVVTMQRASAIAASRTRNGTSTSEADVLRVLGKLAADPLSMNLQREAAELSGEVEREARRVFGFTA